MWQQNEMFRRNALAPFPELLGKLIRDPAMLVFLDNAQSRRGHPKRLSTAGYACWNEGCIYYGIGDEAVHALVGYGRHGRDGIQDFYCQACRRKVTSRRHTALEGLKTPAARVGRW